MASGRQLYPPEKKKSVTQTEFSFVNLMYVSPMIWWLCIQTVERIFSVFYSVTKKEERNMMNGNSRAVILLGEPQKISVSHV